MSQRTKIVAEIWGYRGWNVTAITYKCPDGTPITPVAGFVSAEVRVVIYVARRRTSRCAHFGTITSKVRERLDPRQWPDLPWVGCVAEVA